MSERKELDVLLRNDFYSYVQRVFYELGNEKFIPNWHLEVLCDALERARRGEIKRLIINVPPRSLKSIVVNVAYSTFVRSSGEILGFQEWPGRLLIRLLAWRPSALFLHPSPTCAGICFELPADRLLQHG